MSGDFENIKKIDFHEKSKEIRNEDNLVIIINFNHIYIINIK
jgi:hypothetical protein